RRSRVSPGSATATSPAHPRWSRSRAASPRSSRERRSQGTTSASTSRSSSAPRSVRSSGSTRPSSRRSCFHPHRRTRCSRSPPTRARGSAMLGAGVTVEAVFSADGPLARGLAGYEDRPQQRALASAIEGAFRDGGALIAEAGTGVGKSLAYLVPAIGRALDGERVIVSTHTLPLQDQLVRKDLPALQ